jgi:hypothetical protein
MALLIRLILKFKAMVGGPTVVDGTLKLFVVGQSRLQIIIILLHLCTGPSQLDRTTPVLVASIHGMGVP